MFKIDINLLVKMYQLKSSLLWVGLDHWHYCIALMIKFTLWKRLLDHFYTDVKSILQLTKITAIIAKYVELVHIIAF